MIWNVIEEATRGAYDIYMYPIYSFLALVNSRNSLSGQEREAIEISAINILLNFRGSNKIFVPGIRPEAKKSAPKKVKLNDYPMAKVILMVPLRNDHMTLHKANVILI